MSAKLVATALCLAVAAVAALGAADARSWRDAADREDGRSPATRLPDDPVGRFLALDDDLAFRRAVRAFAAAEYIPFGPNQSDSRASALARAAGALAAVVESGEPRLASRANDLLGVLAAERGSVDLALGRFQSAIVADPTNVNAKRNLEKLLRILVVVESEFRPAAGLPAAWAEPALHHRARGTDRGRRSNLIRGSRGRGSWGSWPSSRSSPRSSLPGGRARLRGASGSSPTPRAAPAMAAAVIACLALAVATARPVLEEGERSVRADSEVVFVVDVSRSMLAASSPRAPTRLERARAAVLRLRSTVPSVPAGVAGLTDRVLPYSFPSPDRASFAEVIAHWLDRSPPPNLGGGIAIVATSLEALTELDRGFFSEGIGRRACVVLTDGESQSFTEVPERRTCASSSSG